ncbi:MAG: 30S ribosomal protein S27ae [Thaumarchaeota archaeon]|jgi:small subunit ribosomal protein S27Ae|nr:30S ribosomal protein S27ae [Nitrososphaerota archaeon]
MRGKPVQVYKLYSVEGSVVKRLRKPCPKCGNGTFLAQHKNRLTCGKCGYTEYLS